jgi:hypothetical protein
MPTTGMGAEVEWNSTALPFTVISISGPEWDRPAVDVTGINPTNGTRTITGGATSVGPITMEVYHDPNEDIDDLRAASPATLIIKAPIQTPGNTTKAQITGSAEWLGYSPSMELDEGMRATLTFQYLTTPTQSDEAA